MATNSKFEFEVNTKSEAAFDKLDQRLSDLKRELRQQAYLDKLVFRVLVAIAISGTLNALLVVAVIMNWV